MLESLTALGLAASVVQFVDFTAKVIKQSNEFTDPTAKVGVLELQNVTKDLLSLTEAFRQRAKAEGERTPDEKALDDLFKKCNALAESLVQCIAKVTKRMQNGEKLGPWNNVRAALTTVWKADKLEAMSKQLDLYRQELILRILVILEARNASHAAHLDNRFDRLERASQQVIEVVAINQAKARDANGSQAMALIGTQDNKDIDPQQRQAKILAAILTFCDTKSGLGRPAPNGIETRMRIAGYGGMDEPLL